MQCGAIYIGLVTPFHLQHRETHVDVKTESKNECRIHEKISNMLQTHIRRNNFIRFAILPTDLKGYYYSRVGVNMQTSPKHDKTLNVSSQRRQEYCDIAPHTINTVRKISVQIGPNT